LDILENILQYRFSFICGIYHSILHYRRFIKMLGRARLLLFRAALATTAATVALELDTPSSSIVKELTDLARLRRDGDLSPTEFVSAKGILLGGRRGTHSLVGRDEGATAAPTGRPVYSVVDFGAHGDNRTDDTAAFQAALNAASDAGGGET
jgi:hypothetical protein